MQKLEVGVFAAFLVQASIAFAAPEPREFSEIVVIGNERFRDGDILATAGLQIGEPLGETDLRAAAEALELTGEFTDVRLSSDGSVLTVSVKEQPEYTGGLSFGLGYDSDTGILGVVGFSLNDVHGPGTEYRGSAYLSQEAQTFSLGYRAPSFWGAERSGGIRFGYENYDYDGDAFAYNIASISPYYNFQLSENVGAEARYTLSFDEIDSVSTSASAILQSEAGSRTSSGVGLSLITGSTLTGNPGVGGSEWSLRFDQDFTGLGGTTNLSVTQVQFFGKLPVGQSGFAIRTRVELGTVNSIGGDDPVATDRFFLGGSALRGFERGTVSPRDVCFGCGAGGTDEITNLGGNHFAVARTDLLIPLVPSVPSLETFVFGDIGTSWGVQTSASPSGTVFEDNDIRSSVGIGLALDTQLGIFESYLALATSGERFDEEQKFGVTFRSEF